MNAAAATVAPACAQVCSFLKFVAKILSRRHLFCRYPSEGGRTVAWRARPLVLSLMLSSAERTSIFRLTASHVHSSSAFVHRDRSSVLLVRYPRFVLHAASCLVCHLSAVTPKVQCHGSPFPPNTRHCPTNAAVILQTIVPPELEKASSGAVAPGGTSRHAAQACPAFTHAPARPRRSDPAFSVSIMSQRNRCG